ncbi:hypothetical protein E2C01_045987 [Portunus trituberculatus]|uniref:Uncharacterized protein n=1 Tax=Portunus trituberculatus TaxID=210409 RepID=A0A5B7G2U8_PORTR|nr:hypothetical protein [Portunus trituberculatus]
MLVQWALMHLYYRFNLLLRVIQIVHVCVRKALNIALITRLHGQHLVQDTVTKSLKAHLQNDQPAKVR